MTSEPRRLLAVAISPLSYLAGTAPSAVEVVHNLKLSRSGEGAWPGEAKLRLSGDRSTLALSMRDSGVDRRGVEIWKLTDRQSRRSGFIVVILQRLRDSSETGSLDLVFDLSQAATMSGCIDVADLRRLGFLVAGAEQARVEGIAFAPSAPLRPAESGQRPPARPRRRSANGESSARRRFQGAPRKTKLHTGCFATRSQLTARIWAFHRQQMFPNLAAIARICETTPEVVRAVVDKREGLEGYLQTGCLLG